MDAKRTSKSGQYWKDHILSWEASAYYKDTPHKANPWDRLSTVFRGEAMYVRPGVPLPKSDLVTALGVIEYFDPETMSAFLGNLQAPYFFLDFPDISRRREFPTWALRQVYIRVNRLPGVYLYRPEEFTRLAEPFGFRDIRVVRRDTFFFATNLPQ